MDRNDEVVVELFRSYSVDEIEQRHGQIALGLVKNYFRGNDSSGNLEA